MENIAPDKAIEEARSRLHDGRDPNVHLASIINEFALHPTEKLEFVEALITKDVMSFDISLVFGLLADWCQDYSIDPRIETGFLDAAHAIAFNTDDAHEKRQYVPYKTAALVYAFEMLTYKRIAQPPLTRGEAERFLRSPVRELDIECPDGANYFANTRDRIFRNINAQSVNDKKARRIVQKLISESPCSLNPRSGEWIDRRFQARLSLQRIKASYNARIKLRSHPLHWPGQFLGVSKRFLRDHQQAGRLRAPLPVLLGILGDSIEPNTFGSFTRTAVVIGVLFFVSKSLGITHRGQRLIYQSLQRLAWIDHPKLFKSEMHKSAHVFLALAARMACQSLRPQKASKRRAIAHDLHEIIKGHRRCPKHWNAEYIYNFLKRMERTEKSPGDLELIQRAERFEARAAREIEDWNDLPTDVRLKRILALT